MYVEFEMLKEGNGIAYFHEYPGYSSQNVSFKALEINHPGYPVPAEAVIMGHTGILASPIAILNKKE